MSKPNPSTSTWTRLALVFVVATTALAVSPTTVLAWSATGHMIAATIAYRALPADLQKKFTTLLASHPEYASWKASYEGNVDEGVYLFMRAAVWPDELKKDRRNPDTHAEWHYINMPLVTPGFSMKDPPKPGVKGDIMVAIEQNRKVLSNSTAPASDRAVALAWLLHLIADLHQPLHTTALIGGSYRAPKGDKGGNDFFVRPSERAKKPVSLHSFWDGLLGTSKNWRTAYNEALVIEKENERPALPELTSARTVRDWLLESRSVAIETVYLEGRLTGVDDKQKDAPVMPQSYRQDAKRVAERRVALAGYRLANALREWVR